MHAESKFQYSIADILWVGIFFRVRIWTGNGTHARKNQRSTEFGMMDRVICGLPSKLCSNNTSYNNLRNYWDGRVEIIPVIKYGKSYRRQDSLTFLLLWWRWDLFTYEHSTQLLLQLKENFLFEYIILPSLYPLWKVWTPSESLKIALSPFRYILNFIISLLIILVLSHMNGPLIILLFLKFIKNSWNIYSLATCFPQHIIGELSY